MIGTYTVLSYLYFHFIARTGLVEFSPNRLGANLKIYPQPSTLNWTRGQATRALQRADCEAQPPLKSRLNCQTSYCDKKNVNALFSSLFIMIERPYYLTCLGIG